jgi:hypothetical protein
MNKREGYINFKDAANMSFYNDLTCDAQGDDQTFDNDPISSNFHAHEFAKTRKRDFSYDPGSPNQLSLITDEVKAWVNTGKRSIYEIGRLLTVAKSLVDHGEFKEWIAHNFDFSYATANNFMNVFKICIGSPEIVLTIKASILYSIAAPGFPEDLRSYILENGDLQCSVKGLHEIAKQVKNGKIEPNGPEVDKLFKHKKYKDRYEKFNIEKKRLFNSLKTFRDNASKVPKGSEWPILPGCYKTTLTNSEHDRLNRLKEELNILVHEMFPDYEIGDLNLS